MHSVTGRTLIRAERARRDRIAPFVHTPVEGSESDLQVAAWKVGGEPVAPEIALGIEADTEVVPDYEPFELGGDWGAPWDTTWFRFSGVAPAESDSGGTQEIVIDFGWEDHSVGFQCEGLVYRPDGTIVKALNPKNRWVPLDEVAKPGEPFEFYVEAASNPLLLGVPAFQPIEHSARPDSYEGELYKLRSAQICDYQAEVDELLADFDALIGLAQTLPEDTARRERILMAIDKALNAIDTRDVKGTAAAARKELEPQLSLPANASAHQTVAMGHAHIDSAWLWPVRETERKVARTVANVLALLEEHEDFVFTMSSAQQYLWLEERYPELFQKLVEQVKAGRIVPVGGMWVEPDGTMPSGESFARQILLGQRYFKDRFGDYCDLMWLPDSFGYSGALPQLAKLGGMPNFLTQKISWNDTNTFPHHSFWWEGLDGTRVLTHFPPSDTYNAEISAAELQRAARNYRDKGISDHSILLFGYGDGGGGPTREMLASAKRFADLEDAPQVMQKTPQEFFEVLGEELEDSDATWSGELYLELHRGTFTSQSNTKVGNRRAEALIRQAEAQATLAALQGKPYPKEAFESAWQKMLLGQFHDILPGTSIKWVHDEAVESYAQVEQDLRELLAQADEAVGYEAPEKALTHHHVTVKETDGGSVIENQAFRAYIGPDGLVHSLIDNNTGRELVPEDAPLGSLALYQDEPAMWDAWDIEKGALDTKTLVDNVHSIQTITDEDVAQVAVTRKFGDSLATTTYRLAAGSPRFDIQLDVDWQEEEKLLKLLLPFDVHANNARFETQFGYVERPIHENTSWDAARFEMVAHRYLHVIENDFGVGVVNDAAYGYSVGKPTGRTVEIGASVLKSANFPDQEADRGHHTKTWGIIATPNTAEVLDEAEQINAVVEDRTARLVRVEDETGATRLSAVKMAEDGSGDVIVRLYESQGGRANPTLHFAPEFGQFGVAAVDLLEEGLEDDDLELEVTNQTVSAQMRPFQVLTLRVTPGKQPE